MEEHTWDVKLACKIENVGATAEDFGTKAAYHAVSALEVLAVLAGAAVA